MEIEVVSYTPEWQSSWDEAVHRVRQASFLFERNFMDYHSDRFVDMSLLLRDKHGRIVGLFPACRSREHADWVVSHAGLTYGGLLLMPDTTTRLTQQMLDMIACHYRRLNFKVLIYKSVPHIYHTYPAEEDLYGLFRIGATLEARSVSTAIDLRCAYPLSTLRRRKVRKADKTYRLSLDTQMNNLPAFWQMLREVLYERHQTRPVHDLNELRLLSERFPCNIRLLTVWNNENTVSKSENADSKLLAGCLLFEMPRVVHVQYIAANDEGCSAGALDWLFDRLIQQLKPNAEKCPYLDFGISTECGGTILNEGLVFQKEGFGGRAVCYDAYKLIL